MSEELFKKLSRFKIIVILKLCGKYLSIRLYTDFQLYSSIYTQLNQQSL